MNIKYFILILMTIGLQNTAFSFGQMDQQNWFSGQQDMMMGGFAASMPVYDMPINVMTASGKQVDCNPLANSTFYKCNDNSYFQPANPFSTMVRTDALGEIHTDAVESIVSRDGDILFVNRAFPGMGGGSYGDGQSGMIFPGMPPADSLPAKYMLLMNLKFALDMADVEEPEFNNLRNIITRQHDEILAKYEKDPFVLELQNGTKVRCEKAYADRAPTEQESLFAGFMTHAPQCGVYDCHTEGARKDQKKKTRLYFQPHPLSATLPTILELENGKLSSFQDYKTIQNANGETLAYERPKFDPTSDIALSPFATSQQTNPFANLPIDLFRSDIFPEIANENGRMADPYFFTNMSYLEAGCKDHDSFMKNLQEQAQEKLSQHQLEQVFMFFNNDMISFYVDPSKAREHFCYENGRFYSQEAYQKKQYNFDNEGVKKILSPQEAQELFDFAKGMEDIAFGYKQDGCYARAHLMARRFEEKGYHVEKAWINGDLRVEGDPPINWGYHVAPSLYVQDDQGRIQRMVIDPSLSDKPITAKEWSHLMTEHLNHNVQETSFPFPMNSSSYRRASLAFTNSDPYYPIQNTVMDEQAKLKAARETMTNYLMLQNQEASFEVIEL